MPLPYPTKVVLPFDIATAQDMNERHANDVALANGSGLDDGSVTPAKRSGGFKVGLIEGSTLGSTGVKTVTGVGFKPKLVVFTIAFASSSAVSSEGAGAMTENAQFATASITSSTQRARHSSQTSCFMTILASGATNMYAEPVSLDADGFSFDVKAGDSTHGVNYVAYG